MARSKPTGIVYQLKVTLAGIRPPIWRRVQVQDCHLTALHEIIQSAMGWYSSHLWDFEIDGEHYGEDPWGESDMENPRRVKLSQLVREGVAKFRYTYDFGDNWEHVILVEKTSEPEPAAKYPRCTAGKRACPPEDCGGPWGYCELLTAISNPDHERHAELLEWIDGEFDPDQFDPNDVNRRLAMIR